MSRAERRALVERENPTLPVSQQCRLLTVSRSSTYRRPAEAIKPMVTRSVSLTDWQYLAREWVRYRSLYNIVWENGRKPISNSVKSRFDNLRTDP